MFFSKNKNRKLTNIFWFFVFFLMIVDLHPERISSAVIIPVEYNLEQLVKQAAIGYIPPPSSSIFSSQKSKSGEIPMLPGGGGITFNFRIGDSAVNIIGDHVEPAVSIRNLNTFFGHSYPDNRGLYIFSCIGNRVRIISGDAKGGEGRIVGKHGRTDNIIADFPGIKIIERLSIGDKIQIYTFGLGIKFKNITGVIAMNISPYLIDVLTNAGMGVTKKKKLHIPVTHKIPAEIINSDLGRDKIFKGDFDIQYFDLDTVKTYSLHTLRFGDLVAVIDGDLSNPNIYHKGAVSIGIISYSKSIKEGHGPGLIPILASEEGKIVVIIDVNSNLKDLMELN